MLLWLVSWLVRASCMKLYALRNTLGVVYAATTNGGTRRTGPQQTTDSSLIILYLIVPMLSVNNSNYCDIISFIVLVL